MRVPQVGEAVKAAPALRDLQLCCNYIEKDGALALAAGLKGKDSFEVIFFAFLRVGL